MLQEEAVDAGILKLIRSLQKDDKLKKFHLAGGTALALHYGHRKSVDIDLFTTDDFDANNLLEHLEQNYDFSLQYTTENTLKGLISGVFVDLISHKYPVLDAITSMEGIRLYSEKDLAAMKVNVIASDGTRLKDFIDLYFLLKLFSVSDIISFYKTKYSRRNDFHAVKSLGFFDDIAQEPDWPVMLKEKDLSLEQIKQQIIGAIEKFLKDKS